MYDGRMAWTVAQLREYRQLPQADDVIARALELAEGDVDGLKFDSLPDTRRDWAVGELVSLYLLPVMNEERRNYVLRTIAPIVSVIQDSRLQVYPPRLGAF